MKFSNIGALCALVAGAVAQTSISPEVQSSILHALATAIPRDVVSYALASSSAFAAEMASSLDAGNTPAWYQALPSDVLNLLPLAYPVVVSATPTPTPTPSKSMAAITSAITSAMSSVGTISAAPIGRNSTSLSGVRVPTLSAGTGASASATRSAPAVATTNAASHPRAALGAGIGAALGVLGMLVL